MIKYKTREGSKERKMNRYMLERWWLGLLILTVTIWADGQGWVPSSLSSFINDLTDRDGLLSVIKKEI